MRMGGTGNEKRIVRHTISRNGEQALGDGAMGCFEHDTAIFTRVIWGEAVGATITQVECWVLCHYWY